jgi:hypothetical protein
VGVGKDGLSIVGEQRDDRRAVLNTAIGKFPPTSPRSGFRDKKAAGTRLGIFVESGQ